MRFFGTLLLCLAAVSCAPPRAALVNGVLDLRGRDWSQGSLVLAGPWGFGAGFRAVPDTWSGDDAGGPDGRGFGAYHITILLSEGAPPLALRYGTAATAMAIAEGSHELIRIGEPSPNARLARSAYAPGVVRLPTQPRLDLTVTVSNHDYRVGGLWTAPTLGPVAVVERAQWTEESGALALAVALAVIGGSTLLLFAYRPNQSFLQLGFFALLIALRSLVTGEYALVKILPGLPFDLLIRLEYLTAFLPLPCAVLFFSDFFPGLIPRWGQRAMTWPSWGFALLTLVLPLDALTRSIPAFYPFAVPALVVGTGLLVRRILADRQAMLLLGVGVLAGTGLADMATAAFFATTGTFVPWGLGLFVGFQATTLARRFLTAFSATEALLAEKELLVREVHHRVKNSLQVVASLVSLQSNRTADPVQKEVFKALRQRITAIALVHEKLYGQVAGGRPDVGQYLIDLLRLQYPGDSLSPGGVVWDLHAEPLAASVDYCIDAGLILTELVANAYRHAFAAGTGKLHVAIHIQNARLAIEVVDSGPGFPPHFRPEDTKGLGFRLVLALLQRNEGSLSVGSGPGGSVRVELRLPSAADAEPNGPH